METLIVNRKIKRDLDLSYYTVWEIGNEELADIAYYGQNFVDKYEMIDYDFEAKQELANAVNNYYGQDLYQINTDTAEYRSYLLRKINGNEFVNNYRSELNPENYTHITAILNKFETLLIQGKWGVAHNLLLTLQPDDLLTQSILDSLVERVNNYKLINYAEYI